MIFVKLIHGDWILLVAAFDEFYFQFFFFVSQALVYTHPRSYQVGFEGVKVIRKWPTPYKRRS